MSPVKTMRNQAFIGDSWAAGLGLFTERGVRRHRGQARVARLSDRSASTTPARINAPPMTRRSPSGSSRINTPPATPDQRHQIRHQGDSGGGGQLGEPQQGSEGKGRGSSPEEGDEPPRTAIHSADSTQAPCDQRRHDNRQWRPRRTEGATSSAAGVPEGKSTGQRSSGSGRQHPQHHQDEAQEQDWFRVRPHARPEARFPINARTKPGIRPRCIRLAVDQMMGKGNGRQRDQPDEKGSDRRRQLLEPDRHQDRGRRHVDDPEQ